MPGDSRWAAAAYNAKFCHLHPAESIYLYLETIFCDYILDRTLIGETPLAEGPAPDAETITATGGGDREPVMADLMELFAYTFFELQIEFHDHLIASSVVHHALSLQGERLLGIA